MKFMQRSSFLEYLKRNKKKHVIFDLDETLVTLKINWNFWIEDMVNLFNKYGITHNNSDFAISENELIKKYGNDMRKKITEINYRHEKKYFSGYIKHTNILEILNFVYEKADLHLWTSNDKRTIMPVLQELKIDNYFKTIVTRNDVEFIKPDPSGFKIINKSSSSLYEFIFIGDSSADKGAALGAGIEFMHVSEFAD